MKKAKKVLSVLLAVLLLAGSLPTAVWAAEETPSASKFIDVPVTQYYYGAVDWAVKRGIVAGTTDTTFSPNRNITRAETVVVLWHAAGRPEPTVTSNPFKDVDPKAYYYKAVLWAYENKIVAGTSATAFTPNSPITREQLAVMLWRYAGSPDVDLWLEYEGISSYAYEGMTWAVSNGIMYGKGNGNLDPGGKSTRAEAVTMLMRYCEKFGK